MAPQDHGDTDQNNIPDDQSTPPSVGDGLPGYPLIGAPGWRAGVPGSNGGALGVVQLADAGVPNPYPLPSGYMYDGQASCS